MQGQKIVFTVVYSETSKVDVTILRVFLLPAEERDGHCLRTALQETPKNEGVACWGSKLMLVILAQ